MMNTSPKFIVFEGIDGAGKTTQIKMLAESLRKKGIPCHITAEPTEYPSGKKIREALSGKLPATPLQMAEMFAADRTVHNKHELDGIDACLEKGLTVISDRYYYSSMAYQGAAIGYDAVARLNLGNDDIRRPDLCIFLDLTPDQSLERIGARANVPTEIYENKEYLEHTRKMFFDVFDRLNAAGENIIIIDACGSVEEVAQRIYAAVSTVFIDLKTEV